MKETLQPLKLKPILAITCTAYLLIACSTESNTSKTPALFNTKSAAEKAAKNFNCSGAHKMGDKWMPCKKHGSHKHHHHSN